MGECGCGQVIPYKVLKINGNKYIVIEKYRGCDYCVAPIGISMYFLDKKGFDEWFVSTGELDYTDVEVIEFTNNYVSSQHFAFMSQDDLLTSVMGMRELAKEYGDVEDFIIDEGLNLLRGGLDAFEKSIEDMKKEKMNV